MNTITQNNQINNVKFNELSTMIQLDFCNATQKLPIDHYNKVYAYLSNTNKPKTKLVRTILEQGAKNYAQNNSINYKNNINTDFTVVPVKPLWEEEEDNEFKIKYLVDRNNILSETNYKRYKQIIEQYKIYDLKDQCVLRKIVKFANLFDQSIIKQIQLINEDTTKEYDYKMEEMITLISNFLNSTNIKEITNGVYILNKSDVKFEKEIGTKIISMLNELNNIENEIEQYKLEQDKITQQQRSKAKSLFNNVLKCKQKQQYRIVETIFTGIGEAIQGWGYILGKLTGL